VLIRQADLLGIASGAITLAFRRWYAPTVKAGGTLKTAVGVLAIDAVDAVDEDDITDATAAAAGYPSRSALLADLAKRPAATTYCIRLRLAGPDPRVALRARADLSTADREDIARTLARLDARSKEGPWTEAVLQTISAHPGRRAADLARRLRMDKAKLKLNVRKLKELGLTESLEVGYRLSPRGEALLRALL